MDSNFDSALKNDVDFAAKIDQNFSSKQHWKGRCIALCLHLREIMQQTYESTIEMSQSYSSHSSYVGNRCTVSKYF